MRSKKVKKDSTEKKMYKYIGEDPRRFFAELKPGEHGGTFDLPHGAKVEVPEGLFGRKDVFRCYMVPPYERHSYLPSMQSKEGLLSEIYLIATSRKTHKDEAIVVRIPFYPENTTLFESFLIWKKRRGDDWATKDFKLIDEGHYAEFAVESEGIYAMMSTLKSESFDISTEGCLYNSRLNHHVSVRFPKKSMSSDLLGNIMISPVNRDILPKLYREYPRDMSCLMTLSNYVDIETNPPVKFKKAVTVKLPLPVQSESFLERDVIVMTLDEDKRWKLLDVPRKFTKTALSFDTKLLSRFCVAQSVPKGKKYVANAFKRIEDAGNTVRGNILAFMHIQEKLWTLWVECVANEKIDEHIYRLQNQGFKKLFVTEQLEEDDTDEEKKHFFFSTLFKCWRRFSKPYAMTFSNLKREDVDLHDGMQFDIELNGEIMLSSEYPALTPIHLHYFSRLEDNYKRFFIEPKPPKDGSFKDISCLLNCCIKKPNSAISLIEEKIEKVCVKSFTIEISKEEFEAFGYEPEDQYIPEPEAFAIWEPIPENMEEVEPTPKLVPEAGPLAKKSIILSSEPGIKPVRKWSSVVKPGIGFESYPRLDEVTALSKNKPQSSPELFKRLSTPINPPEKVERESKVLTGKSLMCLAQVIEEGLPLAFHLDMGETVTAMGFDAYAKGLPSKDIRYQILLHWKRRTTKYKSTQVDVLVAALEEMGRSDVATVVKECHLNNKELTPASFEQLDYDNETSV